MHGLVTPCSLMSEEAEGMLEETYGRSKFFTSKRLSQQEEIRALHGSDVSAGEPHYWPIVHSPAWL